MTLRSSELHSVSSYARYAKKPNTLFRVFLHQAYTKLHSAQVKCMRQHQG